MPKLTTVPSSIDTANSSQVSGRSGQRNGKNSAPNGHRRQQPHEHGVAGAAEVGGEQRGLQVPRPAEVDHDVAGAHPARELAVAPQVHDVEQPLAEPHVGDRRGEVVAGDGAALGQHRDQHRRPQEAEHGVGGEPRQRGLPVGGVALETGPDELRVRREHVDTTLRHPATG